MLPSNDSIMPFFFCKPIRTDVTELINTADRNILSPMGDSALGDAKDFGKFNRAASEFDGVLFFHAPDYS